MDLREYLKNMKSDLIDKAGEDEDVSVKDLQSNGEMLSQFNQFTQLFINRIAEGYLQLRNLYDYQENKQSIRFLEGDFFIQKEESLRLLTENEEFEQNLADVLEVSDQEILNAHRLAARLMDEKKYQEASDAFFFLANFAPTYPDLFTSLGHAEYHAGRPESAAKAYCAAFFLNPTDPDPILYAAHCLEKIGQVEEAKEYLEKAQEIMSIPKKEAA